MIEQIPGVPCVYCRHCYSLDKEYLCYAIMWARKGADEIEEPFTDVRPCKMYRHRQERVTADEG